MKKNLLSLAFLFINYLSYSQISFAVKSGINIATTKDINSDPKNRVGWYGGGLADIPLHKKFFYNLNFFFPLRVINT